MMLMMDLVTRWAEADTKWMGRSFESPIFFYPYEHNHPRLCICECMRSCERSCEGGEGSMRVWVLGKDVSRIESFIYFVAIC